ncbi:imelysin family protein [Neptunomonas sp.]|uniref:imelysin family protein n=1 Tax=Neptunomonas sp. TaxID=1971898 RepID=UPI0025E37A92|nr:imelysin family protein [Neptunomonas sp.]
MLRTGSLTPILLGVTFFILGVGVVHAASSQPPSEEQWHTLNNAIIDQHVIPRYQRLTSDSASMSQQLQRLCAAPSADKLSAAQTSYKAAQASWQGVQHIQFGPVTMLMRNHSLQYWPDKKNTGTRQLKSILNTTDKTFDDEFFRSASISLKGFPALERLLFAKNDRIQNNKAIECSLAAAIAQHIHATALSIQNEWAEEARQIELAGQEGVSGANQAAAFQTYEMPSEAATEFMKSLVEPVEAIRDNKLLKPLAESVDKSRWKKSESWRSEQSINNIQQNLAALHELYSGTQPSSVKTLLEASGDKLNAQAIETEFALISEALKSVSPVTQLNVTVDTYQALLHTSNQLKILQNKLAIAMQTLNIQLGFNSRDGD